MITEKITSDPITQDQEAQISRFFADMLRKMNPKFSKEEAQEIIKNWNLVGPEITKVLQKHAITDKRFGLPIVEFRITVPMDYNHNTQIDTFAKEVKKLKNTYYYNDDLNDKNFNKATNILKPCKTYIVRIYPILQIVQSEDCMLFLKKKNSILVGGQGLALVSQLAKDKLPKGKRTVSFDEKDALWVDSAGNHCIPRIGARSDGFFLWDLGNFESGWSAGHCLLSVCEENLETQAL